MHDTLHDLGLTRYNRVQCGTIYTVPGHMILSRKSGVPGVFEVMARGFTEEYGGKRVSELQPFYGGALALKAGALERHVEGTRRHSHSSRCVVGKKVGRCD